MPLSLLLCYQTMIRCFGASGLLFAYLPSAEKYGPLCYTSLRKRTAVWMCCDAKDMYFKEMKEITHHFKETEEGVEYMCRAFEETRMEGEMRRAIETAKRMIARGKLTLEEIAEDTGLSLEKVQELAGTKTA